MSQEQHEDFTIRYYRDWNIARIVQVRSAYGDAAHMYDAIAADIRREHTVRGKVTKQGEAMAIALKRAGDAIWGLRDKIGQQTPAA